MRNQFLILILRPPVRPRILHGQPRKDESTSRYPNGKSDVPPHLDAPLSALFELHVHTQVREEETGDGIPRPTLHPPRRDDEDDIGIDSPSVARIRHYYHRHVHCIALRIDDIDDPECLARKCGITSLLGEFRCRPEDIEDAIEIGEGAWDGIWRIETFIARTLFICVNVRCPYGTRQNLDNSK